MIYIRRQGRPAGDQVATRRTFLITLGAWHALAWSGAVRAQTRATPVVVGWLHPGSRATSSRGLLVFRERMVALGWKDGSNYVLEERWGDAKVKQLPALAEELRARKPSVIVAVLGSAVIAATKAAPNVPVVQVQGQSPVALGLAASLARPGGMVTGVINVIDEVSEKYVELLLEAAPGLKRIGFLFDSSTTEYAAVIERARRSAARYAVEGVFSGAASPAELESAIARLAKEGAQGLVVMPGTWFPSERRRIVGLALRQGWPVVAGPSTFADDGALITYSADAVANFRRAADYVDRILKGAKPGDLPIEQPMKFDLVLNMKTAKALGLAIPPPIRVRASRVIE